MLCYASKGGETPSTEASPRARCSHHLQVWGRTTGFHALTAQINAEGAPPARRREYLPHTACRATPQPRNRVFLGFHSAWVLSQNVLDLSVSWSTVATSARLLQTGVSA